ncbi:MAG: CARDB domain-containing protein, partial [Methanocaldococcus sp.]
MALVKRKGQLSLEFVLLILGALIAGAIITVQLADNPNFLGNESSNIKKEYMGVFVTEAKFSSNTGTTVENNTENSTNETNTTTDNSDDDNTENTGTTVENNTENTSTNNQKLPDLVPESLKVTYSNNNSEIAHCYREHVQNSGNEGSLENQFKHQQSGKCKNNTPVKIYAIIKNIGEANVTKPFIVALYDNDELVDTKTAYGLNVNDTTTVVFDYTISTLRDEKHKHQNKGSEKQHKHKGSNTYEHTLKIVVDYENTIAESNEMNNEISVEVNILNNETPNSENGEGNLYIDVSGSSKGWVTKDLIFSGDVKNVSGNISKTINSKSVEENANGEVYGDIYLKGSANYKLGNLWKINKFQTYLTGSGSLKVYVPYIQEFIIKDKDSGESQIGGDVSLTVSNANIGKFYVEEITGGADIEFKNFVINTFETNSGNFGGGAETIFENGRISTMKLGNIVGGGTVKFKNTNIGDITINDLSGGPTFELSNSTINNMKIDKLTGNPEILVEDCSIINSLEADHLSGSDIEVKDKSIIKEIIIHGSTGNNGKIFVGDGGKVEKLYVNGSINAEIDIKDFSGLIDVSIGDIKSGGKLYVDEIIGSSISTGIVENGNGLQIEDSSLSFVDIEGVSNSGSASIENT